MQSPAFGSVASLAWSQKRYQKRTKNRRKCTTFDAVPFPFLLLLAPKSGTKKVRKIEENAPLLVLFFTLEKTFESIALRAAREPAAAASDTPKITTFHTFSSSLIHH